jgi:hypothetical protein
MIAVNTLHSLNHGLTLVQHLRAAHNHRNTATTPLNNKHIVLQPVEACLL